MNNNNNAVVESTKTQLVELFMDLNKLESKTKTKAKTKEKSSPQQKLAARRAIEQHLEKKRLAHDLEDYWFDS